MKKHLIAAAVAGALAVPAMAQVSISGALDISAWESSKYENGLSAGAAANEQTVRGTTNAGNTSGSFATSELKFAASEDLGGGLKASMLWSQQLNVNTGAMTGRDGYLRLQGGFGQLSVGRMNTAINGAAGFTGVGTTNTAGSIDSSGSDLIAGTLGTANSSTTSSGSNSGAGTLAGRTAGVIQYTTPSMSGFSVTAEMINTDTDDNGTNNLGSAKTEQFGLVLSYKAGPVSAAVARGTRTVNADVNGAQADAEVTWVGASYDLGAAKLFAFYGSREDDRAANTTTAKATSHDVKVNAIGIEVPLGSIKLNISAYDGENKLATGATDDRSVKGQQASIRYALSKRTYAYGVYGQSSNKDKSPAGNTIADKWEVEQYAIGLVHTF